MESQIDNRRSVDVQWPREVHVRSDSLVEFVEVVVKSLSR